VLKYIVAYARAFLLLAHTALHMTGLFVHSFFYRGDKDLIGFRYRKLWARRALKILGIKIIEDQVLHHDGVALYISNHRTLTDPIVQMASFDSYVIAKSDVGGLPIIGAGAKMTGLILVDRSNIKSRLWARQKTEELLAQGKSVLVYAEGTTTVERKTGQFKIGTFKAASSLGVPVVPVAIEYRDPKDYWLVDKLSEQMIGQVGTGSTHAKIHIGEALFSTDPNNLLSQTQSWIDASLETMQKDWSRVFQT